MKSRHPFFVVSFSLFLFASGCWTVRETEHPAVPVVALPEGKELHVQVAGFDATFTSYDTAYSYSTMTGFGGPWYGRRGGYRGGWSTGFASTTAYIPRTEKTSVFRDRAMDTLERAGCILKTKDPQYQVEVRFEGPYSDDGDGWASFGWMVCTLFTADYGAANWNAKLRIHDLKSGKLVFAKDFVERDEAVVWGPIPIFSPAGSDRNSNAVMKQACLTVPTDKADAEVIAFHSER